MKFFKTNLGGFFTSRISSKKAFVALCGVAALTYGGDAFAWGGSGTASNPYTISSYDDLEMFKNLVNNGENTANAKLTADVQVNDEWEPIGNEGQPFKGSFDGQNFIITMSGFDYNSPGNINATYNGIFGYSEGVIKNVNVKPGFLMRLLGVYCGGICGYNKGEISNCSALEYHTTLRCYDSYQIYGAIAGGIVGYNDGGKIDSCQADIRITNYMYFDKEDIYGETITGGICGCNNGGQISSCTHYNDGEASGAICGKSINGHSQTAIIKNCTNYGDGNSSAGICYYNEGLIFDCENHALIATCSGICQTNKGSIYRCKNYALTGYMYNHAPTVTGRSSEDFRLTERGFLKNNIGGICGINSRDSLGNGGEVYDCENYGEVYGNENVGGIIGYNEILTDNYDNSCYNNSNAGIVRGIKNVGGICGHQKGYYEYPISLTGIGIKNCDNSGDIDGYENVGGICGMSEDKGILKCKNSGIVCVDSTSNSGGICGYLEGDAIIELCGNEGSINGKCHVGGICGHIQGSCSRPFKPQIRDCYNWGDIFTTNKSDDCFGGITGYVFKDALMEHCYNIGNLPLQSTSSDGICGHFSQLWEVINKCYSDKRTAAGVLNGAVCYMLQDKREEMIWGQRIGEDEYPILCQNGESAYEYRVYETETIGRKAYYNKTTIQKMDPVPGYPSILEIYGGTGEIIIIAKGTGDVAITNLLIARVSKYVRYRRGENRYAFPAGIYSVAGMKIIVK